MEDEIADNYNFIINNTCNNYQTLIIENDNTKYTEVDSSASVSLLGSSGIKNSEMELIYDDDHSDDTNAKNLIDALSMTCNTKGL
jgi:hypothetical protein